jgi:hypothetical protein
MREKIIVGFFAAGMARTLSSQAFSQAGGSEWRFGLSDRRHYWWKRGVGDDRHGPRPVGYPSAADTFPGPD